MSLELRIEKIGDAKLPDYHYAHDAGFDLYCAEEVTIKAGERALIGTGIKMAIPEGYAGLIWDKGGVSNKKGLKSLGGVVDTGYRGEVKVGLVNISKEEVVLPKHEPIAQMLIQKVEHAKIVEGKLDDETERGVRGFDSRGI